MTAPARRIGIGGAGLSLTGTVARDQAITTICAALDAGATVLDSAAAYIPGPDDVGYCDALMADALDAWSGDRAAVTIVTKGGHTRLGAGWSADDFGIDGSPAALRRDCEASLRALRTDSIDLYFLHWPDPNVPIADSVGALADLRAEGKIERIGVSNVTVEQLGQLPPVDAVQNQFSIANQRSRDVLDWCADRGIDFFAYSPLGGLGRGASIAERVPELVASAARHGVSPQRVALAWLFDQSPVVIPIVGATRVETARDSVAALRPL